MKRNKILRRRIFFIFALGVITVFMVFIFKKTVSNWPYFSLRDVIISGPSDLNLPNVSGVNLFSIDLKELEKKILFNNHGLKNVKVLRQLPHTLIIETQERLPVAKLLLGGRQGRRDEIYAVDDQGIFLDLPPENSLQALPRITGLLINAKQIKRNVPIDSEEIGIALELLENYSKINEFEEFPIHEINLSDSRNIFFKIRLNFMILPDSIKDKYVKIIIGKEDISAKLKVLSSLLPKIKSNLTEIKYIDLRFKDPVAGKN